MKIIDITEAYDQPRHSVEASVMPVNIIDVSTKAKKYVSKVSSGEINPQQAVYQLELLQDLVGWIITEDENYWGVIQNTMLRHYEQLGQDWIDLENDVESYITQVKNKFNLREIA